MSQDPKLDSCPFCNEAAEFYKAITVNPMWKVHCANPRCPVRPFTLRAYTEKLEAAAVWNYRPASKPEAVK